MLYSYGMATKLVAHYLDDLDGSVLDADDVNTVTFSYRGSDFEIDLSEQNAEKFGEVLAPYIAGARKVGRTRAGGGSKRASSPSGYNKETLAQIREWGSNNGFEVSPRGRVSAKVIEAWEAAH